MQSIVLKYWREILLALCLAGGLLGYRTWRVEHNARLQAEMNVAQSKVDLETFKSGVTQANNELMKSQKDMLDRFSSNMQDELTKQRQTILAQVQGSITTEFAARSGTGVADGPTKFHYSDSLMSYIGVDATDSHKPKFDYKIAPLTINLDGSLNFSEKNGVASFWVYPSVKGSPDGVMVSVPRMDFTPGKDFVAWETELRGHENKIPVMPKWTINALLGKEWAKEFPGGTRTVYGADFARNFSNGAGVGGGFIGSTVFLKGGLSFGKN